MIDTVLWTMAVKEIIWTLLLISALYYFIMLIVKIHGEMQRSTELDEKARLKNDE